MELEKVLDYLAPLPILLINAGIVSLDESLISIMVLGNGVEIV